MREHISIFNKKIYGRDYIDLILRGKKTADAKFSNKKIPPYGKLYVGDRVYLKESGKNILGHVEVQSVVSFELKGPKHVREILQDKRTDFAITTDAEFEEIYATRKYKKYCTLFYYVNPVSYIEEIPYSSKGRSSWVTKLR